MLYFYYYRGKKTLFDGHGRSFGIKQSYKNGSVSWRCTCRSGRDWCRATVLQRGEEFIFGKNIHTCKAKLDKSLHAQIEGPGGETKQFSFSIHEEELEPYILYRLLLSNILQLIASITLK
jgi:hypothetical protein